MSNRSKLPHYFVPLGRERGSYLHFLGLPPDAEVGEVERKKKDYIKNAESTFKLQRKALREERDEDKTISGQEYDAKVKELEEERTKKERTLNELEAKFETAQAEKRGARGTGHQDEPIWIEMYQRFADAKEFWHFLLRPRPPGDVPKDLLLEIEQRWITPYLNGQDTNTHAAAGFRNLASQSISSKRPVDLTTLAALVTERDLICLLLADALWSELRYTNREYWQEVVERWVPEVVALGPRFRFEATGPPAPDYPALNRPTNLMIKHLESEEMVEIVQAPQRGGFQREPELGTLLAELLAQQEGRTPGDPDGTHEVTLEPQQLEEILELLRQQNEIGTDQ